MTIKAVFFDISGVLYQGHLLIAGAAQAVAAVHDAGLPLRLVTNTSRKTTAMIRSDLANFGIATAPEEVITAPSAARDYLARRNLRPWCLVHRDIQSEFAALDQREPNAVVIGDAADDLNYQNLNRAFQLCHAGAELVGIGANRFFREGEALLLDAGPFIKAIEYAASVRAIIMGKPAAVFFQQAVESVGCEAGQVLMVGDDVLGDVEGAINAGLQACLVRTGKYQPGDEQRIVADFACVESVADVPQMLAGR